MQSNSPQQVEQEATGVLEFAGKNILQSKTVIGILVGAIVSILPRFGIHLVDADTQDLIVAASAVFAIYGRYRAKQPLRIAPEAKTSASALLLFAFAAVALLYLTACGANGGTRWVESVGLNGAVTRDDVTKTTTGTGGVQIHFRDGRDSKTIKPLTLRGDVLDEATKLGGPLRTPFRLDIETMDERVEQLVIAPDGLALVVPKL